MQNFSPYAQDEEALLARAWQIAAAVPDPEIPVITIADLGVLRTVTCGDDGIVEVALTPTYSGCPAVLAIELSVQHALERAGIHARIKRVISPAWTTDWISDIGREKLRCYGVAPPQQSEQEIACPQCDSHHHEMLSYFGATACKALYRCLRCGEAFEYFKCL